MKKNIFLTIGKLGFTKKAIYKLILAVFISAVVFVSFSLFSIKTETNFNILFFLIANYFVWHFTFEELKGEVVDIDK